MSRDNLKGLMIERLRDLHHAEHLLVKALPPMAIAASNPALKDLLERHVVQTVNQSQRLDKIFKRLGADPRGRRCRGMEGILAEAYECVRRYALLLGRPDIADFVQQSLEEEEAANERLAALAEHEVDFHALA